MSHGVASWIAGLALGVAPLVMAATPAPAPGQGAAEQAAMATVPPWHGHAATVIRYLDLTSAFDTASPWALVVVRDPRPRPMTAFPEDDESPVAVCFVDGLSPRCSEFQRCGAATLGDPPWYTEWAAKSCTPDRIFHLVDLEVVYAGVHASDPLLLLKTADMGGGDGSRNVRTTLYRYDRAADVFHAVFVHDSGGTNNNQYAQFVTGGPLRGDEIVDFPTQHPPYVYWVEVFAPAPRGAYRRILRYRSITHYGDGNPLPVADSEQVEILRRPGLWKPGDALPTPSGWPWRCGTMVLRHGEEWCQASLSAIAARRQ